MKKTKKKKNKTDLGNYKHLKRHNIINNIHSHYYLNYAIAKENHKKIIILFSHS